MTFQKSLAECPLSPIPDIQVARIKRFSTAAFGQNRTFPAAISRHGFFGSGPNFERLGLGDLLGGIDERHPHNLRGGLPVRRFHVDIVAEFSQLDRQPRVPNILLQPG